MAAPTIAEIAQENPELCESLATFDRAETVARVSVLMTIPALHAQSVRIEVLQHLALIYAKGSRVPSAERICSWLNQLGKGSAGLMEDPPEDVFVSRMLSKRCDYRVFNGVLEASAYQLQRFMNAVEDMPNASPFREFRAAFHDLLRISDELVGRSGLDAFDCMVSKPRQKIECSSIDPVVAHPESSVFTDNDLVALKIDYGNLSRWVLPNDIDEQLASSWLDSSPLNKYPLLSHNSKIIVVNPSLVSTALRLATIQFCYELGLLDQLLRGLAVETSRAVSAAPLLGRLSPPQLPFRLAHGYALANVALEFDVGYLINFCFLLDSFEGYAENGMLHSEKAAKSASKVVQQAVDQVCRKESLPDGFRGGLFLIVCCQWGRPMAFEFDPPVGTGWRFESISCADLEVLSHESLFSLNDLWRLIESVDAVKNLGGEVHYVNGLLNLYGWAKAHGGSLIPHDQMPQTVDHQAGAGISLIVPTDSLMPVRRDSAVLLNTHHATYKGNQRILVTRFHSSSFFDEDRTAPVFAAVELIAEQRLLLVLESPSRNWWLEVKEGALANKDLRYRLFHALSVWLRRFVPVAEREIAGLPQATVYIEFSFEDVDIPGVEAQPITREHALRLIELDSDFHSGVVKVTAKKSFLRSFKNPENIGESALVEAMLKGCGLMANEGLGQQDFERVLSEIVPNPWARDMHFFQAREFGDFVRETLPEPLLTSDFDQGLAKLGFGFPSTAGSKFAFEGKEECCQYLNSVVSHVWASMRALLVGLNRRAVLERLVENHQALHEDSQRWLRTSRAITSSRLNPESAATVASMRLSEINGASLATRLLQEMAVCECAEEQGLVPSDLDLKLLMVKALQLHHLGGQSEAIFFEGKVPEIKTSILGDVLTHSDFDDHVLNPYGMAMGKARFSDSAANYEKNFAEANAIKSVSESFDSDFIEAWRETFGFSIDDARVFADAVEDEAISRKAVMFFATQSDLTEIGKRQGLAAQSTKRLVETLSQVVRPRWDEAPIGYRDRDWSPWRFRRRLSTVVKPLLPLSASPTAEILVPAGSVRNSVMKLVGYCYDGDFDARDFPAGRLRSWIGKQENLQGHAFNRVVGKCLSDLGWEVETDVKLTRLLNCKLERDYGDIDVLAWSGNRVLLLECKDLEVALTQADIARQLYEFRGVVRENGKPDRLKKHQDRCVLLRRESKKLQAFVGSQDPLQVSDALVFSRVVPLHFSSRSQVGGISILTREDLKAP